MNRTRCRIYLMEAPSDRERSSSPSVLGRAVTPHRRRSRCGSILLMVLVAIILMTLTTSSYLLLMRNEHWAARTSGNHLQAEMLSQSGIEFLRVYLAQTPSAIEQQGGLFDNPDILQDVLVIEDTGANHRGRFTVVAPNMNEGYYHGLRYGLENESAKLNLNTLTVGEEAASVEPDALTPRDRLLLLPGMNEAVADAILDWIDEDDSPRTFGAESSYYQTLTPPYRPSNRPLQHLDELLMIQGVTPELLYGIDGNRNYLVDANEQPLGALQRLDNSNGQLNRGWLAYLTVHSLEKNLAPAGDAKIDLNAQDLQTLHRDLEQALGPAEANFIIAYRQFGSAPSGATGPTVDAATIAIDLKKEAKNPIDSLLSLIDIRVRVTHESPPSTEVIESPWKDNPSAYRQGFSDLLDWATVDSSQRIAGRININQASYLVLLTIPGMTENLASQILARRDRTADFPTGDQRHPTWLIAENLIPLAELKPMFPFVTTGGDVYRAQVVGFFDAGTVQDRVEVLLDRSGTQDDLGSTTRLLDWQSFRRQGPGFPLDLLRSDFKTR